jgi:hypothetical protein
MIEPHFLSIQELASRWGATERQILEHGSHFLIPMCFLFNGLAFQQADRWLMGHGANDEESELATKKACIAEWENHLRRNAVGLTDQFSRLDEQQVSDLRKTITEYEQRIAALTDLLDDRLLKRRDKTVFGYLRLPPRIIVDIQQQTTIPFPHLALNQAGELLTLEPAIIGKWKSTLSASDLLIPLADIKALEAQQKADGDSEEQRQVSKARLQELAIIREIRDLGYEPTALPPMKTGKPWVKKEVWSRLERRVDLFISRKTFESAWERLRGSDEIAEQA